MKEFILASVFLIILSSLDYSQSSGLPVLPQTQNNKLNFIQAVHRPANYNDQGIWQKRIEWKARIVKEWHEKKILVPMWRKVWGPIEINEWVPLPKLPPWNPYEQKVENVFEHKVENVT